MTECTADIRSCRIDLVSLAEKLLQKIINTKQKSKATDELRWTTWWTILDIVKKSFEVEEKVFGFILKILKDDA